MKEDFARSAAWLLAAALVAGCASTPKEAEKPAPAGRMVVGSGTGSDRVYTDSPDQQISGQQHGAGPVSEIPNRDIP